MLFFCRPTLSLPDATSEVPGLSQRAGANLAVDAIQWAWAEQLRRLELARWWPEHCRKTAPGPGAAPGPDMSP